MDKEGCVVSLMLMEQYWNWVHEMGIHIYTIPAIILIALMVIFGVFYNRKEKKKDNQQDKKA